MSTVYLGKANGNETETKPRRGILLALCFQRCSGLQAVKAITALPQVITDPTMVTVRGAILRGGSVVVGVEDRPYYVRGPGYWSGRVYVRLEAGTLEVSGYGQQSLDTRPLRRARILTASSTLGGLPGP